MKNIQNEALKEKKGTIALAATPKFRERKEEFEAFCYSNLYFLCSNFDVVATGGTCNQINEFVNRPFDNLSIENRGRISSDWMSIHGTPLEIKSYDDLHLWKKIIKDTLFVKDRPDCGVTGMIDVISRLVQDKIDAVIHLTDWQDKNAKQDTAVLCREANVHNVPIASNVDTAEAFIAQWRRDPKYFVNNSTSEFSAEKVSLDKVFEDYNKNNDIKVLAMISHNGKKSAMDTFTVENYKKILKYDYILATEATGERLIRIMKALTETIYSNKICCCKPGPKGGDLQIAEAVIKGICKNIIFFQDPEISQPHDADIKLFEQAVTSPGVHARFASNPASAALLVN